MYEKIKDLSMLEENQNQSVQDDSVESNTKPEGNVDFEAKFGEEVKYAKKQREKRQAVEKKLAEMEAKAEEDKKKKMIEEGKQEQLIAELESKLKEKDTVLSKYLKQEEADKQSLVADLASSDEEQEQLATLPYKALKLMKKKLNSNKGENPQPVPNVGRESSPKKDFTNFTKMSAQEKRDNWEDVLKSFNDNKN